MEGTTGGLRNGVSRQLRNRETAEKGEPCDHSLLALVPLVFLVANFLLMPSTTSDLVESRSATKNTKQLIFASFAISVFLLCCSLNRLWQN